MALRIVQVGVGGFGKNWVKVLAQTKLAELVGIVDVSESAMAEARASHGIPADRCFATLKDAIRKAKPQAVINVTPPQHHRAIAVQAMRRKLHVLTEKPLSDEMPSARAMVKAAAKAGVVLMVSQNYRNDPKARAIRREVASGRLGDLGLVEIRFFKGPHFGGFREEMEFPLVKDMSIHHFDMLRFFTGRDPQAVQAISWKPAWSWFKGDPAVSAAFEFPGGLVASYSGSWVSGAAETPWGGNWRLEGDKGTITWVNDEVTLISGGASQSVAPDAPPYAGLEQSLSEFVTAVTEGKEPATSGRDNLKSLAMVFSTVEAAKRHRRVALKG